MTVPFRHAALSFQSLLRPGGSIIGVGFVFVIQRRARGDAKSVS